MHVTLMHNPRAGEREHSREALEAAIRESGHTVTYQSTKEKGYKKALREPGDLVVVAGGDGTVEKMARKMVGRGVPMAILPLGTANNVASSLGVSGSPTALIRDWSDAEVHGVDVGTVRGPWGERHFVEGAGVGLFACSIAEADEREEELERLEPRPRLKEVHRLIGRMVRRAPSINCELEVDGRDLSGEYLLVQIMNTPWIGPSLLLGPRSDPTDGQFELVLSAASERESLHRHFERRLPGETDPLPVDVHHGSRIRIAWEGVDHHIDDEMWPEKKNGKARAQDLTGSSTMLQIELVPGALQYLVPRNGRGRR